MSSLIIEPKERPELATGKRHTVNVQNAYLNQDSTRVLVNFQEQCSPASFPIADFTNDANEVVFAAADGLAFLQDFLFKANTGAVELEPGVSVPLTGQIEGSYVERNGFHNWSLVAWKSVG